jgi:ribonucleoside-diphosphate reductase beta chain
MRDYSKQTNYLNRQMFLDPAGQVTVQRFENCRYPKIQKFEAIGRGFFWVPEEINVTKDKADFKDASQAAQWIFTQNVLRQSVLDSLQGRAPSQIFVPVASVPEVEALATLWSFIETNIHSNSYSHIIRAIYNVPSAEFNKIHDNGEIIAMTSAIDKHYDHLHRLNCKYELGQHVSEDDHIDAIWLALHASYALEALRFMVSFATSLAMVENKIFIGNGAIISLILQDEILHADWSAYIINQVVKDDPRFRQAKARNEAAVLKIYYDVIAEEKNWADHLFKLGPVIGLNADILKTFVDFTATNRLKDVGIKYEYPVKTHPIPWFNKHVEQRKQTALQENESQSYLIGAMSSEINYDSLPDL